jgi:hypothetical protein
MSPTITNAADHTAANSGSAQFILQTSDGSFSWDANGGSGADAVQIAVLTGVAALQAGDIQVV